MGLEWYVISTGRYRWRLVTKPAPMISLILWFTSAGHWQGGLVWFGLALVFSLLGDIFLLFPFRLFLPGLIAFSLAHICHIIGLNQTSLILGASAVLIILGITGIAVIDLRPVFQGVRSKQSSRRLFPPVLFYAIIISLMLVSAWLTLVRPAWMGGAMILVLAGASLFYVSDSLLAREKFIHPVRSGGLIVMVTYLIGQLLIASGAIWQHTGGVW
jgi:uncharacterized membrane protein YhhN